MLDPPPEQEQAEETAGSEIGEGLAYRIIVECKDETQQATLIDRFEREGLSCQPLIS
jgi:hypothetical protein